MPELTPVERIALANCLSSTQVKKDKAGLRDNAHEHVNLCVQLDGTVAKGVGTSGANVDVAQSVDLYSPPFVHTLLSLLGVTERKLKNGLAQLEALLLDAGDVQVLTIDDEFDAQMAGVASRLAQQLPKVNEHVAGRQGTVNVHCVVRKVE